MKAIESHYVCSTKKFIHGTHIMLLDTGMFNSRYSLKEHTHTHLGLPTQITPVLDKFPAATLLPVHTVF